jgi:glycosyltransferase involved in cell wall biosynthesis
MKVSIAMATYNGMPYIQDQLFSIKQQTHQPNELIICDDCSSDGTVEFCEEFSKYAPFKVLIQRNEENLGYSKNFEKALALCTNDVVFICDQDDYWKNNKIETVLNAFLVNEKTQLIIHDIDYCDDSLNPIGQTKLNRISSYTSPNTFIAGMASAIRKSFLVLCLPIPNTTVFAYDSWLHACAMMISSKMILPESLALYRRHNSNVTNDRLLNVAYKTTSSHFKFLQKKNMILKSPVDYLHNAIVSSRYKMQWIKSIREELISKGLISESEINRILSTLFMSISLAEERLDICHMPFFKRLLPAIMFQLQGKYGSYSGYKSFLKDIFYWHGK